MRKADRPRFGRFGPRFSIDRGAEKPIKIDQEVRIADLLIPGGAQRNNILIPRGAESRSSTVVRLFHEVRNADPHRGRLRGADFHVLSDIRASEPLNS